MIVRMQIARNVQTIDLIPADNAKQDLCQHLTGHAYQSSIKSATLSIQACRQE